jgi:ABC-type phosphate transport system substrate-binding protein
MCPPGRAALRRTSIAAFILLVLAAATIQNPVASADLRFQVVVHPAVEGSAIKRETLSSIFLGELSRWGTGVRVKPVDQSMRSPVRAAFTEEVLSRPFHGIQFYWADMIQKGVAPPPVKQSDAEVIKYVARTEGAVGYVSLGAVVPDTVKTLSVID